MSQAAQDVGQVAVPAAPQPAKSLRADARRNRDALLKSATRAFSAHGTDASLEDIAKKAGVGIGTLYRHFPARHDLIEAVYWQEVEALCLGADELLATHPPDEALVEWMRRFVDYVGVKKGLVGALKEVLALDSPVFTVTREQLYGAVGRLIDAAVAAGTIRDDTTPDDLLRGLSGFCMVSDDPGWRERAERLVTLLVDGLRYGAKA